MKYPRDHPFSERLAGQPSSKAFDVNFFIGKFVQNFARFCVRKFSPNFCAARLERIKLKFTVKVSACQDKAVKNKNLSPFWLNF